MSNGLNYPIISGNSTSGQSIITIIEEVGGAATGDVTQAEFDTLQTQVNVIESDVGDLETDVLNLQNGEFSSLDVSGPIDATGDVDIGPGVFFLDVSTKSMGIGTDDIAQTPNDQSIQFFVQPNGDTNFQIVAASSSDSSFMDFTIPGSDHQGRILYTNQDPTFPNEEFRIGVNSSGSGDPEYRLTETSLITKSTVDIDCGKDINMTNNGDINLNNGSLHMNSGDIDFNLGNGQILMGDGDIAFGGSGNIDFAGPSNINLGTGDIVMGSGDVDMTAGANLLMDGGQIRQQGDTNEQLIIQTEVNATVTSSEICMDGSNSEYLKMRGNPTVADTQPFLTTTFHKQYHSMYTGTGNSGVIAFGEHNTASHDPTGEGFETSEFMRINDDGNLLIGSTVSSATTDGLQVRGGKDVFLENDVDIQGDLNVNTVIQTDIANGNVGINTAPNTTYNLHCLDTGNSNILLEGGVVNSCGIYMTDDDASIQGLVAYNTFFDQLSFWTDGVTRATIDSTEMEIVGPDLTITGGDLTVSAGTVDINGQLDLPSHSNVNSVLTTQNTSISDHETRITSIEGGSGHFIAITFGRAGIVSGPSAAEQFLDSWSGTGDEINSERFTGIGSIGGTIRKIIVKYEVDLAN